MGNVRTSCPVTRCIYCISGLANMVMAEHTSVPELPILPDSTEDFLIFREDKPIREHVFDNLCDSGFFFFFFFDYV